MKPILFALLLAVAAASCSKDKTANMTTVITANGTVKLAGVFYATQGIAVNGNVKILSNGADFSLLLENFQVSAGPDLKLYLSKKDTPFEFINLGPLKNNSGNQTYDVPNGTDFTVYKYALIHCQQYNHLFAIAELKK
jgi:Electron transfer DM13